MAALAKMRGIKADIWTDEKFVSVSPLARLLFIGMWNFACDNGHLEHKPRQIKMRVLPADDCQVDELLAELVGAGLVLPEAAYLLIPTLPRHQKVDKRYFRSCPHCSSGPEGIRRGPDESPRVARRDHGGRATGARVEGEGDGDREGEGTGDDLRRPRAARATELPHDFTSNDNHRRLAATRGVDLDDALAKFVDHAQATGKRYKDWSRAFNNWIRNERPTSTALKGAAPLPRVGDLELPPDGLSDAEYVDWQRTRQGRAR